MPRSRSGAVTTDGHITIRCPGAYLRVLRKRCEEDAHAAAPDYLLLADSEIPAWERDNAERAAALLRERTGKPVNAQSYMLPDGLPPPFDHWPRGGGGRRSFVVSPDDTITLKLDGQT